MFLLAFCLHALWRPRDYQVAVAAGLVSGAAPLRILGRNTQVGDVSNADNEDVWDGGGAFPVMLKTAEHIKVSSTKDETGGAQSVIITGVDAEYNPVSERLPLQGTSAVSSTKLFSAVNRMEVTDSTDTNTGVLSAVSEASDVLMAVVATRMGASMAAKYYVAADQTALLQSITFNINIAVKEDAPTVVETRGMAHFLLWVHDAERDTRQPVLVTGLALSGVGYQTHTFAPPLRVPPKSQVFATCWASVGVLDVTAEMQGLTLQQ